MLVPLGTMPSSSVSNTRVSGSQVISNAPMPSAPFIFTGVDHGDTHLPPLTLAWLIHTVSETAASLSERSRRKRP